MTRYVISGLALALVVFGGCTSANEARLEPDVEMVLPAPSVVYAPPSHTVYALAPASTTVIAAPTTTGMPVPAAVVTTPAPAIAQMLQAEDIKAQRVRAHTVYANRIDADEIRGVIHQDKTLKVADTRGEITGPELVASVIYADEIQANSIIAEHIYVKDLRRR